MEGTIIGVTAKKLKRKKMNLNRVYMGDAERRCATFFLDSGAHSIYTIEVIAKHHKFGYSYYQTMGFKKYVDAYARFLKANKDGIDHYANVDAIFNPDITWRIQRYLEKEHGLKPVPVIHYGTDLKWVDKYLNTGHTYLGIGGLGQEVTKQMYLSWADRLFDKLCSMTKNRTPVARTHGFAMTSFKLIKRYPWWSVDSASWAKLAGFGSVMVPHKRKGQFTFDEEPYTISFGRGVDKLGKWDWRALPTRSKAIVQEWLDKIEIPVGTVTPEGESGEYGVWSQYAARALANLRTFEALRKSVPEYPWAFNRSPRKSFF